jgi:uncharacterized membrane protein (UPF0127 family)
MANFLLPMIRDAERAYQLRNVRTGQLVAHTIVPAFESPARRRGLLGRDSFPDGSAMIIAPSNAIHTFWMRFAIDVVFVRRNGVVVKVQQSVSPWRVAIAPLAYAAIELPAGALRGSDVSVGDILALVHSSDATDERFELGRLFATGTVDGTAQVHGGAKV